MTGIEKGADIFQDKRDIPHYFRFRELRNQRYYQAKNDFDNPTGKNISVRYDCVYNLKTNCTEKDLEGKSRMMYLNDSFRFNYTMMLKQIEEGFGGNPQVLYTAIVNCMHNLSNIANEMVQIRLRNNPTEYAAPTFTWHDSKIERKKINKAGHTQEGQF